MRSGVSLKSSSLQAACGTSTAHVAGHRYFLYEHCMMLRSLVISGIGMWRTYFFFQMLNPFRTPEPLPILNPSNFVPKNEFPVVKGLT